MRAELYRPDAPESVVAIATWSDGSANLEVLDESIERLDPLVRPTPVVVDDPSLRPPGTHGEALLEPGSSAWFRAALQTRAEPLGLRGHDLSGGMNDVYRVPAAWYLSFDEQVDRWSSS